MEVFFVLTLRLEMFNCEVLIREDATVEQFIDVIVGKRKYMECIYVYNKIDSVTIEEVDRLARLPNSVVVSCELDLNVDFLIYTLWARLGLKRIYTKRRSLYPDFNDAIIMKQNEGFTVRDICKKIHKSLVDDFKFALVWGKSAKYNAQRVGLVHSLDDEDVIQIIKKNQ